MKDGLIVGTRTSTLALRQTQLVIDILTARWGEREWRIRRFTTTGDKTLDKPLPEIGGKGLFTQELEEALRRGEIDAAVHSLKDLPVEDAPGLVVGAVTARLHAEDCIVALNGWTLETLPRGAIVGTSSIRRGAQLLAARPDLTLRPIRGNVETRIRKVREGDYDAAVMARAGLERLGLMDCVTEVLDFEVMLPAPGQGALAAQCRAGDDDVLEILSAVEDAATRAAVTAERTFLRELGAGCSAPVGAYATTDGGSPPWRLSIAAVVGSGDGTRMIRVEHRGEDPETLGKRAAQSALQRGAGAVLAETVSPLGGKRVVITRAREQSEAFCRQLESAGAEPVVVPTIRIVPPGDKQPLDAAAAGFMEFDWVVFTSANGVRHWWKALAERGLDSSIFEAVRVAAVGEKTAAALRERGVDPEFVPDQYLGAEVARGLEDVGGKRICLLRAKVAGDDLPRILRSKGANVIDVAVYENVPAEIGPEEASSLKRDVDVLTFTSASTVRNFVAAVRKNAEIPDSILRVPCACIGPVTAAEARKSELAVRVVAPVHTADGLFDALVAYFDKERRK